VRLFAGGGGLAGTAEDYMRFCQMLIAGGQLDGTRLVSRKTIEAMTANQIGPLTLSNSLDRNYGFGLGFRVRREVGLSSTLGSVGDYGWGGIWGTYFWVDPVQERTGHPFQKHGVIGPSDEERKFRAECFRSCN
jgi:CubicO group peptidase (beta-lactamase class C family)